MALFSNQLEKILYFDQCSSKKFQGVFAKDELPDSPAFPSCFILNTHSRAEPGEHWLALFYDKYGHASFFDSYGHSPTYFDLENYIQQTSKSWSFNGKRIQGLSEYCGYYCVLFLLYKCRGLSHEFYSQFTKNLVSNDLMIKKLIQNN